MSGNPELKKLRSDILKTSSACANELLSKQLLQIEKTCYRIERDTIELNKKMNEMEKTINNIEKRLDNADL